MGDKVDNILRKRGFLCSWGEEKNISSLGSRLRPTGKFVLSAPKGFAGKRKSGSRFVVWARCVSVARESLLRSVGLHKSLRLEIFFSVVSDYVLQSFKDFQARLTLKARRGTGEKSEDLRDTDRDAMQKAKHAFKRPPLKHVLKGLLWTRFRFLHGVVQSIPQGVALEAERFLLFLPHHNSNLRLLLCSCGEEKNISSLGSRLRPTGEHALSAPKGFAGKRKSGSRFVVWARCVSVARESLLRSVGLHKSLRLEIFFSVVTDYILQSFKEFQARLTLKARRGNRRNKRRSLKTPTEAQ